MRNALFILLLFFGTTAPAQEDSLRWEKMDFGSYTYYYTGADIVFIPMAATYLQQAHQEIRSFFKKDFDHTFRVTLFPHRALLDSQWSRDWKIPGFKSECWMIASGVSDRLDILSPLAWRKEGCDHDGEDSLEVQQVITHEMIHVFHAQQNPSSNFDGMDDLSWLIEGLATYASGQLTAEKIKSVREQIAAGTVPPTLADFWKGKLRYQQAGSLIRYVDEQYGRKKLISLLSLTTLPQMLETLGTTERGLIEGWEESFKF